MTTTLSVAATAEKIRAGLDLSPISLKLQATDPDRWTIERLARVERVYCQFLALHVSFPEETFVPTKTLDAYWHQHILDTRKYAEDCEQVLGHFLHHDPYFGLRDEAEAQANRDAFERTGALWQECFGEAYVGQANPCSSTDCR